MWVFFVCLVCFLTSVPFFSPLSRRRRQSYLKSRDKPHDAAAAAAHWFSRVGAPPGRGRRWWFGRSCHAPGRCWTGRPSPRCCSGRSRCAACLCCAFWLVWFGEEEKNSIREMCGSVIGGENILQDCFRTNTASWEEIDQCWSSRLGRRMQCTGDDRMTS